MNDIIKLNISGTIDYCEKDILCRSFKLKNMLESNNFINGVLYIDENYHNFMKMLSMLYNKDTAKLYIDRDYKNMIDRYTSLVVSCNIKKVDGNDESMYRHNSSKNMRHVKNSKRSKYVYFVRSLNRKELDYFYHLRSIRFKNTKNIDHTIRIDIIDKYKNLLYSSLRSKKRLIWKDGVYDSDKLKMLLDKRCYNKDIVKIIIILNKKYIDDDMDSIDMKLLYGPYIEYYDSKKEDNIVISSTSHDR